MPQKIHFISGLPRSGSTLLSAILRQNPRFHAAMSSPVGAVFNSSLSAMGAGNEFAVFLDEEQKRRILQGIFEGYYHDVPDDSVIFDTNRMWTARLPALLKLYPGSKVICCVRNPAWILDSVENLVRKNAFDTTRIFSNEAERATVYSRAEALAGRNRMIGYALSALKEAYFSNEAGAILLLDYNLLAARPADCLKLVYQFLEEEPFDHQFDDVSYEAEVFDSHLLAKGLHSVSGKVELKKRRSILPPELFKQFSNLTFWIGENRTLAHHIVPKAREDSGEQAGG